MTANGLPEQPESNGPAIAGTAARSAPSSGGAPSEAEAFGAGAEGGALPERTGLSGSSTGGRATAPGRRRHLPVLVVLVLLVVLAAVLSWPVIAHLSSRLPGTATWAFDESTFAWNIWHFKHALIDQHASPLHSELIWYPLGIDLILYTYNFFNALVGLPLLLAANVPFASNLTLILATVLSGLGAYLLALYVLRTAGPAGRTPRNLRLAALVAGLIYAFASNRAIYAALGHYDMVTTQWLPFYALYLLKLLREPRPRNAVMAGLFFALAALAEMIFASFLAVLSLVIVAASWRELSPRRAALGRLALAASVAALIWSPVLVPIVREFVRGGYALEGWGESIKLSADLAGLVTPTDLNPLFTGGSAGQQAGWTGALRAVEEGRGRFRDINTVFLGWVTLGLAVCGAWLGRRVLRGWIWAALVFGLLCLGPLLQIGGRYRFALDALLPEGVTFPLPFAALHFLPFLNANRAPNRNSVILMLALAVLAGYAVCRLLASGPGRQGARTHAVRRHAPFLIAGVLAVLILGEHLAAPLPTTDAAIPEVYRKIGGEPGEFAVLQLPLGWRNSFGVFGSERTQLQYFQTAHGKPMLGGNISRAPAFKMAYFERIALFRALTDLEMHREVTPEVDAEARAQAGALMALYDVRYFITTPSIPGRYPYQDTRERTEAYALDVLPLEKPALWEEDGYRVYRVRQPAIPLPFELDPGEDGIEPYLGQGWDLGRREMDCTLRPADCVLGIDDDAAALWAIDDEAELYLPAGEPEAAVLRIEIAPLSYEGAPSQTLTIEVNGAPVLAGRPLEPGWQTVAAEAPAGILRRGPNRVRLIFARAESPRAVWPDPAGRAMIGATGVVSPVNLDVHSFAEAYITATGPDGGFVDASVGRRGYNVAVLDPDTGELLDAAGFDTAANRYEADALAEYLGSVPDGRIVAVATKGDATAHLTPAAIAALQNLGSRVPSFESLLGQSHALVGVQGAARGAAVEVIAPGDAFLRVAGDFRELAAAVRRVELGR